VLQSAAIVRASDAFVPAVAVAFLFIVSVNLPAS